MSCYNHYYALLYFLITAVSCNAMEQKQHNILQTLTCIKEPLQALYVTNNRIIIRSKDECSIVDPTTDTKILQINKPKDASNYTHVALHPNTKIMALSNNYTITLHDTETGTVKNTLQTDKRHAIKSSIFSPMDDFLMISFDAFSQIANWRYTDRTTTYCNIINESTTQSTTLAYHPTRRELCSITQHRCSIALLEQDASGSLSHIVSSTTYVGNVYYFCHYSSDGSFIIIGAKDALCILRDSSIADCSIYYKHDRLSAHTINCLRNRDAYFNESHFEQGVIHPNNSCIAVLLHDDNVILYINPHTQELMHEEPPLYHNSPSISSVEFQSLSFSPDGRKLLVSLPHQCVIFNVPFDVIYQEDTKKQLPHLLLLLKNIDQNLPYLPDDIKYLLACKTLQTFKR